MLSKLSIRNMRRSLRDYALYFGTLIISVTIFYVFNSLANQSFLESILFRAPEHFTANIEAAMTAISAFVSVLLIFLIIYGNSFLIKRREKELGVYLTLGMDRTDVAKILFGETFLIAVLAIVVGIGLGVPLSQLMSVMIFHFLGVYIPGLTFVFSWGVVFRTTLYFGFVFLSVSIVNVATVSRSKILHLLSGSSKQVNFSKFFGILSGGAFILALVGFGYWVFTTLTLDLDDLFGLNFDVSFTEDGLPVSEASSSLSGASLMLAFSGLVVGVFAFFLSLAGVLAFIVKRCKKITFYGLNVFTLRQLTRRLHLNWLSLSFITLMMTVSIFMLVAGRGTVLMGANAMVYTDRPFDGTVSVRHTPNFDALEVVDEVFLLREFELSGTRIDSIVDIEVQGWIDWINGFAYEDVSAIFDFHNTPLPTPASNEILLLVSGLDLDDTYLLKEQITVTYFENWVSRDHIVEETFDLVLVVVSENLLVTSDQILIFDQVVLVFPPSLDLSDMPFVHSSGGIIGRERNHFLFDFNVEAHVAEPIFWEFARTIPSGGWNPTEYDIFHTTNNNMFNVTTTNWIRVNSNLMSIFLTFATLYIGGIFLLVSLTILFLQQMIDVVESKKRYATLLQLGVDDQMRSRSLLAQGIAYFLIPLTLASLHSFFALQILLPVFAGEIGDSPAGIDFNHIVRAMSITFLWVVVVYLIYFILSYVQTKRVLDRG